MMCRRKVIRLQRCWLEQDRGAVADLGDLLRVRMVVVTGVTALGGDCVGFVAAVHVVVAQATERFQPGRNSTMSCA